MFATSNVINTICDLLVLSLHCNIFINRSYSGSSYGPDFGRSAPNKQVPFPFPFTLCENIFHNKQQMYFEFFRNLFYLPVAERIAQHPFAFIRALF